MKGFEGKKRFGVWNSLPEETRLEEINRISCKDYSLKLRYFVSARTSFPKRYSSHLKQNKSETKQSVPKSKRSSTYCLHYWSCEQIRMYMSSCRIKNLIGFGFFRVFRMHWKHWLLITWTCMHGTSLAACFQNHSTLSAMKFGTNLMCVTTTHRTDRFWRFRHKSLW